MGEVELVGYTRQVAEVVEATTVEYLATAQLVHETVPVRTQRLLWLANPTSCRVAGDGVRFLPYFGESRTLSVSPVNLTPSTITAARRSPQSSSPASFYCWTQKLGTQKLGKIGGLVSIRVVSIS